MLRLLGNFVCADTAKQTNLRNDKRKPMPYQYKREPLNNDEANKLTNTCNTFRGKFVIWTFLNTEW
jgi:hypothetical protein